MRPDESLEANLIRMLVDRPTRPEAELLAAGIVRDISDMMADMYVSGAGQGYSDGYSDGHHDGYLTRVAETINRVNITGRPIDWKYER
jgi:hypothetical protein